MNYMLDNLNSYFIDSNILVYAYDIGAGEKYEIAQSVIEQLWNHKNGCLSIQVLQEFYVVVTQKIKNPLARHEAIQIISNYSEWRIHVPDVNDILRAIQLQQRYSLSFWDAMIVHSANQLGCKTLFTEDMGAGQIYGNVRLENPFS